MFLIQWSRQSVEKIWSHMYKFDINEYKVSSQDSVNKNMNIV